MTIPLKNTYKFFPKSLKFHTQAPENLVTLYEGVDNYQTSQTNYDKIIGYLLVDDQKITLFDHLMKPVKNDDKQTTSIIGEACSTLTKDPKSWMIKFSHKISIQQSYGDKWVETYEQIFISSNSLYHSFEMQEKAPISVSKIFSYEENSPSEYPDHILHLIEKNEKHKDSIPNGFFLVNEYCGLEIYCELKSGIIREFIVGPSPNREIIRKGLESCSKKEFYDLFVKHAGTSEHEKIGIMIDYQSKKDIEEIYENFIVKSRKMIRKKDPFS